MTSESLEPTTQKRLPEVYCVACSQERPEEFQFIHEAEEDGCIVFTGHCARHMVEFLNSQRGICAKVTSDGGVESLIGGRTFVPQEVLPDSGMKWRAA